MSNVFNLFSESTIKTWFSESGTTNYNDENEKNLLITIVNGVVARCEEFCDLKFVYQSDYTEIVKPKLGSLKLELSPVSEVYSIIPLIDGSYSTDNALSTSSYYVDDNAIKLVSGGCWSHNKYQVNYSGGYQDYLSTSLPPLPNDLAQAMLIQVKFDWENRKSVGVSSVTDLSGSRTQLNPWGLLPGVIAVLRKHKVYSVA